MFPSTKMQLIVLLQEDKPVRIHKVNKSKQSKRAIVAYGNQSVLVVHGAQLMIDGHGHHYNKESADFSLNAIMYQCIGGRGIS